jgi:type 2 lantibiotic biosynthesis protein LanM
VQAISPEEPENLPRRFAWDCIDLNALAETLHPTTDNGPIDAKGDQFLQEPNWVAGLHLVRNALRHGWDLPLQPYKAEPAESFEQQLPFVELWLPVIEAAIRRLKELLPPELCPRPIAPEVYQDLGSALLGRLVFVAEKALFERFNRLRTPGAILLAHLGTAGDGLGPPVRERYEQFIFENRRDGLESLLDEFPVLGRFLGTVLEFWFEASTELLKRVSSDAHVLAHCFGVDESDPLAGVSLGLGDTHRRGRAVAALRFTTATGDRLLVYKPRPMELDQAYQQALEDLNRHINKSPLKTLQIHCEDGYGYMEYVQHRFCNDSEELSRFYGNAGRVAAVLYVLGCTDCHYENLIACGDQLLLIDAETLLDGDLADLTSDTGRQEISAPPSDLREQFNRSVLRSGLLPCWFFLGENKIACDVSALGVRPPQSQTEMIPGWLGLNTDGMMPGLIQRPVNVPTSLPVGVGHPNPLADHLDVFCKGFQEQCLEMIRIRGAWLGHGGVLDRFEGLLRRIVVRCTRVYAVLNRSQLKPQALRSSLQQGLVLEELCRAFLMATERPRHWPIFDAEVRQMEWLDIPFFVHAVHSSTLHLGYGLPAVHDLIETSGLQASRNRLATLNAESIDFQLQLIRGSCNALAVTATQEGTQEVRTLSPASETCSLLVNPLEEAQTLLDKLESLAIRGAEGELDWLGMDLGVDGKSFTFGPVGSSLYGGSIGIALLAASVGSQEQQEWLIPGILLPLHAIVRDSRQAERIRWWRDQSLGLNGSGGILLALLELDRLGCCFDELHPADLAATLVESLSDSLIAADNQLDIIGGCAGLIGPLLEIGTERAIQLAIRAGERLLETQHECGGWLESGQKNSFFLGFSHGSAGYAAALSRLYVACGQDRFMNGAKLAIAHIRRYFDREHGNWPGFRLATGEPLRYVTTWCHGAPGIALGRACLWGSSLWDERTRNEMVLALTTTAAESLPEMDHLCCGALGLAGLLRGLADGPWISCDDYREQRHDWRARSEVLIQQSLSRRVGHGTSLRCFGVKEGSLLLPGCFTGLSGMGLALVDQARPSGLLIRLLSAGLLKT